MFIYSRIEKAYFNSDFILNFYVLPDREYPNQYVVCGDVLLDSSRTYSTKIKFVRVPIEQDPHEFLSKALNKFNLIMRGD